MTDKVIPLHAVPEPHHEACDEGCKGGLYLRDISGPCESECAKTPEFQARCAIEAEASRNRFRASVYGKKRLGVVPSDSAQDL